MKATEPCPLACGWTVHDHGNRRGEKVRRHLRDAHPAEFLHLRVLEDQWLRLGDEIRSLVGASAAAARFARLLDGAERGALEIRARRAGRGGETADGGHDQDRRSF